MTGGSRFGILLHRGSNMVREKTKNIADNPVSAEQCTRIITKALGAYVNEIRTKNGISIRKLSKDINVSSTVISDFENGTKIPRMETIIKIVWFLDIPLNKVFGRRALPVAIFNSNTGNEGMSIAQLLAQEGLSMQDTKEVLDYIEFRKYKKVSQKSDTQPDT